VSTYVGYVIDGRYRVEGVLGRGGMGVVYRARHEVMDKLVAIKILLPTEDGDVVERFVNEARAATAIGNAHIVGTVDFGELPDGSTYFVMEYLEGQTLARRIKTDGFIPVRATLQIARQIVEGMSAAHRAGIVHRDLKPENIFLTRRDDAEDFVKLLDFGIAKMQNVQNRITRAGTIFGTPHYMSPEQAAGAEVDPRTDIYSLGIMLYEMLSGAVPFDAENPLGLLTQHMYSEPVPLGRLASTRQPIPSPVDAIVLKCLAKKPEDRYGSMGELREDIERAERGDPPHALAFLLARALRDQDRGLATAAKHGLRGRSGGRWVPWTVAALVFLGAGGVAASRWASHPPRRPALHRVAATPLKSAAPSLRRTVALVFSPIDGEVFRDGRSLGGMPVTLSLAPGEVAEVEVRREGFYPEKTRLDGARAVVVLRLTPIPGVEPSVPVPSGEPLEALRRAADAGALRAHAIAVPTPDRRDARAPVHPDAGAGRATAAALPPGAPSAGAPPESIPPPGASTVPPPPGPPPGAPRDEAHASPTIVPRENTPPPPSVPAP
jgi:serine/threonine-protein kinase